MIHKNRESVNLCNDFLVFYQVVFLLLYRQSTVNVLLIKKVMKMRKKTMMMLLMALMVSVGMYAQSDKNVYEVVDVMPSFPGG